MSTQHILVIKDHTGDSILAFDPTVLTDVERAEKVFDDLMKKNHLAYVPLGEGKHEQVRTFDPNQRETLISVPLVGG